MNEIASSQPANAVGPSPLYRSVDSAFSIDGIVENSNIEFLASNLKGCLYLCSDTGADKGAPDGFESFKKSGLPSIHIPFDSSSAEFQPTATILDAVNLYKKYEAAIEQLPAPIVISCKSNRRASAVYSAYKAIKENISFEKAFNNAKEQGFTWVNAEGMTLWVNRVVTALSGANKLIFRQLFEKESSTYTYLLADSVTKETILIDPVLETVDRDNNLIKELGLKLKYVINTHVHADHITGSGKLKQLQAGSLSAIAAVSTAKADIQLNEGDVLEFGTRKLYVLSTPGHTQGCLSYVLDDVTKVFTGDALLIRGCGRTDFQGGSASTLYNAIHSKLFKLPDDCHVYPAHDYKGLPHSTIYEEKTYNPRLTKSESEFINIMNNLNLPRPKKIDEAVPANLVCGVFEEK